MHLLNHIKVTGWLGYRICTLHVHGYYLPIEAESGSPGQWVEGELASFVHCKITAFASSTVTDSIPKQNQDQPPPVRPRGSAKASVVVTSEVGGLLSV